MAFHEAGKAELVGQLDRDGTINVDYHYVGHIKRLYSSIPQRRRRKSGASTTHNIPVAIAINQQGGVARGFYTEQDVRKVHAYITEELALNGANIDLFLYSPDHPDGNILKYSVESFHHKPNPGMAIKAKIKLDLDLRQSYVVGDRHTDIELAKTVGAQAIYLGTEPLPLHLWGPAGNKTVSLPSLADAAGYIIERITGVSQSEFPGISYHGMISYWTHYADEIRTITARIRGSDIAHAAELLMKAYNDGGHVFVASCWQEPQL